MKRTFLAAFAAFVLALVPVVSFAGGHAGWKLEQDVSKIAFGSVKKDTVGETHNFSNLSGMVSETGELTIAIDLASVETWIDIRNERIVEHVFHKMAQATLSANLDMDKLLAMPVGGMDTVAVNGKLSLMGAEVVVQTDMFVVRLAENKVLVTSDEITWVSTEELGIDDSVSKLMELAKLPGITRAVPVTARLVFSK